MSQYCFVADGLALATNECGHSQTFSLITRNCYCTRCVLKKMKLKAFFARSCIPFDKLSHLDNKPRRNDLLFTHVSALSC